MYIVLFKESWFWVAIFIITAIISCLITLYIEKKFIRKTDEKSIIDDFVRKHPIKFKIIGVSVLLIAIFYGQNVAQKFLYNTASIVKKDDVINSDYFKNLDEHKK